VNCRRRLFARDRQGIRSGHPRAYLYKLAVELLMYASVSFEHGDENHDVQACRKGRLLLYTPHSPDSTLGREVNAQNLPKCLPGLSLVLTIPDMR
jgi:hypothetical protein